MSYRICSLSIHIHVVYSRSIIIIVNKRSLDTLQVVLFFNIYVKQQSETVLFLSLLLCYNNCVHSHRREQYLCTYIPILFSCNTYCQDGLCKHVYWIFCNMQNINASSEVRYIVVQLPYWSRLKNLHNNLDKITRHTRVFHSSLNKD